jgi:lysophospholipase L1-like esterase
MSDRIRPSDLPYAGDRPSGVGLCKNSNGDLLWDSGSNISNTSSWSGEFLNKPVLVVIGDSINAGQNYIDSAVTLSGSGNIGTIGTFGGNTVPGQTIFISGVAQEEWNGEKIVATYDSATSTITFINSMTLTASPTAKAGMAINVLVDNFTNQRAFLHNFNAAIGNYYDIRNRAVSGTTSAETLANFSEHVLSLNPAVIYDNCGINDVNSGTVAEADTIANITAMADLAASNGIKYWRAEITPILETGSSYSLAKKKQILRINQAIRRLADIYPNFVLIPANAALTNKSTGNGVTSYWSDATGIHPNSNGMHQIYKLLLATFSSQYPVASPLITDGNLSYNYDNASKQAVRNPLMLGTQAASGTGVSGNIPTNCSAGWDTRAGTGTVTFSVANRSDGYGQNIVALIGGTTNDNDRIFIRPTIDKAAFVNGDIVRFSMSCKRTGAANLRAVQIGLFNSSTYWNANNQGADPGSGFDAITDDVELTLVSKPILWGDWQTLMNALNIWVVFKAGATGTFEFGRVSLEKVG